MSWLVVCGIRLARRACAESFVCVGLVGRGARAFLFSLSKEGAMVEAKKTRQSVMDYARRTLNQARIYGTKPLPQATEDPIPSSQRQTGSIVGLDV